MSINILHIKRLPFTQTDPIFEVTVQCGNCLKSKQYTPTLNQMKNLCDDWEVHKVNNIIQWVAGNTRLLHCPNCNAVNSFKICIHRNGTIIIYDADTESLEGWNRLE